MIILIFYMSIIAWKLVKTLLIVFFVIVVLFLNYALFAWFLSTLTTTPTPKSCQKKEEHFFVSSNGVHVDIILPLAALDPVFLEQLNIQEGTTYVGMGWGDEGFYLKTPSWAELDWRVAAAAIFLPTSTLMHVTHYQKASISWKRVWICCEQKEALLTYIKDSFRRSATGELCYLPDKGYGSNDFFYKANGYYTGLYTCNIWANQALKKAQVKTAIWSPLDKGIMKHL